MNTTRHELTAKPRILFGKKNTSLRKTGQLPANIFGKVEKPFAIAISLKDFTKTFREAGETGVVYMQIEGEKQMKPTLIDQVDYHNLSHQVLHVSFRQVDLKQKVTAGVKIELVGELVVKDASAQLMHQELEVEALPTDLPESFEIDLSRFSEIGQEFSLSELNIDQSKMTVELPGDTVLLQIQKIEQMAEEVAEAPTVTPEEVETTVQGSSEQSTTEATAPTTEEKK